VASEVVRAEMTRQGVTQEAIAATLGLRRQNVSTRLAGIVAWSPEQLATVADLLTVPVTQLLHNSRRGRADAVPRRGALTDC
jgi:transcriptional regulator with XRE-family HTH domain